MQQTVEVKEVEILIRGIWRKKSSLIFKRDKPLRLRRTEE